jgi:hypothetical protein
VKLKKISKEVELVLDCGNTIDCGEDWSLPPIWQDKARLIMYLFSWLGII